MERDRGKRERGKEKHKDRQTGRAEKRRKRGRDTDKRDFTDQAEALHM